MREDEVANGEAGCRGWQLAWPKASPLCGLKSETPGKWGGCARMPRLSSVVSWDVRAPRTGQVIARPRVESQSVPAVGRMALKNLPSQMLARLYGQMDCTGVTEVP